MLPKMRAPVTYLGTFLPGSAEWAQVGRSRPGQVGANSHQSLRPPQADDPEQTPWVSVGIWGQTIPWDFMPSGDQSGQWGVPAQPVTFCFERVHSEEAPGICSPVSRAPCTHPGHHPLCTAGRRLPPGPLTSNRPPPTSTFFSFTTRNCPFPFGKLLSLPYTTIKPLGVGACPSPLWPLLQPRKLEMVGAEQTGGRELGPTRSPGPHLLQCTQSASGLGRTAAAPVNERNRQGLGSLPPMCALSVIPK